MKVGPTLKKIPYVRAHLFKISVAYQNQGFDIWPLPTGCLLLVAWKVMSVHSSWSGGNSSLNFCCFCLYFCFFFFFKLWVRFLILDLDCLFSKVEVSWVGFLIAPQRLCDLSPFLRFCSQKNTDNALGMGKLEYRGDSSVPQTNYFLNWPRFWLIVTQIRGSGSGLKIVEKWGWIGGFA